MSLNDYGWSALFADSFEPYRDQGLSPGRVVFQTRGHYRLISDAGEIDALTTGRMRHQADESQDLPIVGDWVAIEPPWTGDSQARIQAVLPRTSKLSRKVAGTRTREQAVAANIDTVFLVMGLDGDFNPRRMERLLVTAWESGALPVVVLNKADLCDTPDERRDEIEAIAPGAAVLTVSFLTGDGLPAVGSYINKGETIALIGSSGVGKSTLVNRLCGREVLRTKEVRARDERGQHTTTHRQLILLPDGGLLIDNPGIRELALWSADQGLGDAFQDIEDLAPDCQFRDCRHESEPGCAVRRAVENRELGADRLESFRALGKELRFLELRQDGAARRTENKKTAVIHKAAKKHNPRL